MKTNRLLHFVIAFSLAAFTNAGCAEKEASTELVPGPATTLTPTPAVTPAASAQWTDYKGFGFDMREQVFAGLKALEARVDGQISELAAKREELVASNTSTQAWDFAMQEMTTTRTALKSAAADLTDASRETWDQMKDRVGDAWTRTQDAYAKVKASTTK